LIRALSLFGLLANAGVVVLLFALSYYVFGGPEGPLSDPPAIVVWIGAMAICLGAAIGGWRLVRSGSPITGLLVTWMPPLVALALVIAF
jgi:phosphate/sulfate permease